MRPQVLIAEAKAWGENADARSHNKNMNGMNKEKQHEDAISLGREFSPRRELTLMARVMTRWLRANGFPDETVSFEVRHPLGLARGNSLQKYWRACFVRGERILMCGELSKSREDTTGSLYGSVVETLGASTAAELEIRFAVAGPDNVGRILARGLVSAAEN